MPNHRRSARLNPGAKGSLTMPEAQTHIPDQATFVEGADSSPNCAEASGPVTGQILGGGDASGPAMGLDLGDGEASGTARSPTKHANSGPVLSTGPGLGGGEALGRSRSPTQHADSGPVLSTGPVLGGGEASGTARSPRDAEE